jgi:hypothetical protein
MVPDLRDGVGLGASCGLCLGMGLWDLVYALFSVTWD